MGRRLTWLLTASYCLAILLACDWLYSNLIHHERHYRTPDPRFDHTLTPNFDGYDRLRGYYRVRTNNLGFKDETVRDVPARSESYRVLLIGDSFTEGAGLRFEQTFAGLLYRAGRSAPRAVEFLNAGVATYSPVIYYRKIKHLIESGLRFDEVIVFSDISDVPDEATAYFCIDEDPQYRKHCSGEARHAGPKRTLLQHNFAVIDGTIRWAGETIRSLSTSKAGDVLDRLRVSPLAAWTTSDDFPQLKPLGVAGGIQRSQQNMKKLADLLRRENVKLSIAVYPWMLQLATGDRDSRQVRIWREFCAQNCDAFIDLFPAFFAAKDAHADWLDRLFIPGDFHFSAESNRIIFREIARRMDLPG